MSTRYFKHENGHKMVFHDSLGTMHYCPASGFVECDANWQPLKPVVREWVSDARFWKENRWRQEGDGPLMYLNDIEEWVVSDWKSVDQGLTAHAYEVHPGTRTPIDQPLPSSDPAAKAQARESYLDGKLNAVAEAVSGLVSRVENVEAELHAMLDRMREHEKHVADQWLFRSIECDRFSARLGKVAERLDSIEANARRTDAVVNELSGKMVAKPEPIHIQVASLIAVNQKLEADLRIVRKERDELQACVDKAENRSSVIRKASIALGFGDPVDTAEELQRSIEAMREEYGKVVAERDELRTRVDRKPDVPDDPYPRTYRLSGNWYVTFDAQGVTARAYTLNGGTGGYWFEHEIADIGAVRCPDPRANQ